MLVSTVNFVDMYIDMQNLAWLVLLPSVNQSAKFSLLIKVSLAHMFVDKNTTNTGEPPGISFFEQPNTDVLFFQYLLN